MIFLPMTLILLAAPPAEEAQASLAAALSREVKTGAVSVSQDGKVVVVTLHEEAFFRVDPLWRALYAVAKASRAPGSVAIRVNVVGSPERVCGIRRAKVRGYLFDKQRADRTRLEVAPACVDVLAPPPAFAEPEAVTVGDVSIEAPRFLVQTGAALGGVSVRVTNGGEAPVGVDFQRLDLLGPGAPVQVVPITGLWFSSVEPGVVPVTEVRKNGRGPTRVAVPPKVRIEVMLQFEPPRRTVQITARRVRVAVEGKIGIVAGPVEKIGFHEGEVQGRKSPPRELVPGD